MGHQLTVFLAHYGLLALFVITFVKAIGVPIPVPADLVVLAAATGSASGKLAFWQTFAILLVAMVCGSFIQFLFARGPGRHILYRFGHLIGLTPHRIDLAFHRVENVGILGIALAVVTPGIRTAAIPACGLTSIPARTYAAGLALGTTAYISFQFFLAYGLIKLALRSWNVESHVPFIAGMVLFVGLLLVLVVWHRTVHMGELSGSVPNDDRVLRSHICPLCWLTVAEDRLAGRTVAHAPLGTSETLASALGTPAQHGACNDPRLRTARTAMDSVSRGPAPRTTEASKR